VQVQNPNTGMSVFTYAVLDAGSQTTCCTPRLVKELGLKVRMQKLHLTMFDRHVEGQKKTTRLHLKTISGEDEYRDRFTCIGTLPIM
jgi:hypothetical protein